LVVPIVEPIDLGIDALVPDGIFGIPLALIFVVVLGAVFTGRSAPMGIIFIAVGIGVMLYLGILDFNFDPSNQSDIVVITLIIVAVIVGLLLGKRWD
jgi:hypothetical protein